ncbi:MAG: hypothetical protein FWC41_05725 [Firmicutes bacterium]|nr:hypothetical protein [Bacillota bacterium]
MKRTIAKISSMMLSLLTLAGTTKAHLKETIDSSKVSISRDKKEVKSEDKSKNKQFSIPGKILFGLGIIGLFGTSMLVKNVVFSRKVIKETEINVVPSRKVIKETEICDKLKKNVEELGKKCKQGSDNETVIENFVKDLALLIKSVSQIENIYLNWKKQKMIKMLIDISVLVKEVAAKKRLFNESFVKKLGSRVDKFTKLFKKDSLKEILYNAYDRLDCWGGFDNYPEYKKCKYMNECSKKYATDRLNLLKTFKETVNSEDHFCNDFCNDSVLTLAAKYCGKEEFALLIEFGADINSRGSSQFTPLMYLADADKDIGELKFMIKLLIDRKADLSLKDNKNRTALDIAKEELKYVENRPFKNLTEVEKCKEIVDILNRAAKMKPV